jgi:hypothetical protein
MRRSADLVFGIYQFVVSVKRSVSLDETARMSTAKGNLPRFTLAAFDSSLVTVGGGRVEVME